MNAKPVDGRQIGLWPLFTDNGGRLRRFPYPNPWHRQNISHGLGPFLPAHNNDDTEERFPRIESGLVMYRPCSLSRPSIRPITLATQELALTEVDPQRNPHLRN